MGSQRYKLGTHVFFAIIVSYLLLAAIIWLIHGAPDFSQKNTDNNSLWFAWLASGLIISTWQYRALKLLQREIMAINLHADGLRDSAFNLSANPNVLSELAPLANVLSDISNNLQLERARLYQRELLLDTVLQTNPSGLVLIDERDRVLLSNPIARILLNEGKHLEGSEFSSVLLKKPEIKTAIDQKQSLIFLETPASVWHLSINQFHLNQHRHCLYQFNPITREIHQEELKAWKKLLRVIGHELNNSLAPMSSLAYSGRRLAEQKGTSELADIFTTISDRCAHLNLFLQEYIAFTKLPPPNRQPVNWVALINEVQDHYDFELVGELPKKSWSLDQTQIAQLLMNLLKNSYEAGATATGIQLQITEGNSGMTLELVDNGGGMKEEFISNAFVPFYTTKDKGSGLGLTLCQEIVRGHSGSLQLSNHTNGLLVTVFIPN